MRNIQQETTVWADKHTPNHTYVFDGPLTHCARAVAYIPQGSTTVVKLNNPMYMNLKGRTFRAVR